MKTDENKTTLTPEEINYLRLLLSIEIEDNENIIKKFENFSIDCSDIISNHKLEIDRDRIIYDKLSSLYCSVVFGGAEK